MNNTEFPVISIIIPVKNGEKTIEKAILSVLDQDYPHTELIILDGGSTDNTVNIIRRYESHISYWHSKADGNPYLAENEGISRATGMFIGLLMGDDWYEKGTFTAIAKAYRKHPEFDVLTCGCRLVTDDHHDGLYQIKKMYTDPETLALNIYNICFASSVICSRFIKKSLYERAGLFPACDEQGRHIISADKEFLLKAVLAGAKNLTIDHLGYTYLSHPGSSSFDPQMKNAIRLIEEHIMLAMRYINHDSLTAEQKRLLRFWHKQQLIYLAFFSLHRGKMAGAYQAIKEGICCYPLSWFFSFTQIAAKITYKYYAAPFFKKLAHVFSSPSH